MADPERHVPGKEHDDAHPPQTQLAPEREDHPVWWTVSLMWGMAIGFAAITILLLLAIAVVLVLTNTDWGRERVRRFAVLEINKSVHGQVSIGHLSGNLLLGLTAHDIAITDSAGKPFITAESARTSYSILSLARKRIWLSRTTVIRPLVVLDRPPGGQWNFKRIFPQDTTKKPPSNAGWGDWLSFTDSRVVQGTLIIRTPWHPRASLSQHERDSVVRSTLAGHERLVVERVGTGFQKIVRLDSITGRIPQLMLEEPGLPYQFAQIASARFRAIPFHPPTADVRDLRGLVKFTTDSAWWKDLYAALPNSKSTSTATYSFDNGDLHLKGHVEPALFADLRWAYPDLPPRVHGRFDVKLDWVGPVSTYHFTNGDLRLDGARANGEFGVTFDDTTTFHDTRARFSGVTTRILAEIFPGFSSPRSGTFSGEGEAKGGVHVLDVNTDITFDDDRVGRSRAISIGRLKFFDVGGGIIASGLRVRMMPVKVAMARTWMPTLPLGGDATGSVVVNGRTNHQLTFRGVVEHVDRDAHSVLDGSAIVRTSGKPWVDVDVLARPVALAELGRFAPSLGLRGNATGPVRVIGTLDALRVTVNVRTSGGGHVNGSGTFDLASRELGYDFSARFSGLNLGAITYKTPSTSLTGTLASHGTGLDPRTMRSVISADLSASRWDTLAVDTASARGTLNDGLAHIDRLYVAGSNSVASVSGTFGLTREHSGTLTYRVAIDSLGAFNRWFPRGDTTKARAVVAPRPRVRARALLRAKEDSARLDHATEMERLLSGKPAPKLVLRTPQPVRTDTLAGSLHAEGTIRGNVYVFDIRGRANGERVVVRGNTARRMAVEYAWMNARTPESKIAIGADGDSVSLMGFAFDTVNVRFTKTDSGGHAEVVAIQDQAREYAAKGDYSLNPARNEVRLTTLALRFDTTAWTLSRPATFRWGETGIHIGDFELHALGRGRLYVNGLIPARGNASVEVHVENFPVSNITDILQTEADVRGNLTLHGQMTGSLESPGFEGEFAVTRGRYNRTVVPDMRGTIMYLNQGVELHAVFLRRTGPRAGEQMATLDGRVPINLALTSVNGSRIPNEQMAVVFVADSLPLELIPELTSSVSNVHGHAGGRFTILGTLRHPLFSGGFHLERGTMTVTSTGATFDNVNGIVHLSSDTIYVDSIAGTAKGPVRLRGTIALADWRNPRLNLTLRSSGAQLMNNDQGTLRADANLTLTGPLDSAYVRGRVTVTQGVIHAPETTDRHVINADDPALFNVIDTAIKSNRELFPPTSPLLAHLHMDVALRVNRNTWVRNREANVEIFTEDPIQVHMEEEALSLTGVVTSDRGTYNFLSKRFQIKRGAAIFVGGPDLNPTLQITGEYAVGLPSRGTLNIRVLIGGTLRSLTLSLESDAQPPRTQSELLSLLAFGQSATSLLATGSSSIAGTAATSDLFGVGAQVAARRLAGIALGVAANQVEGEVGKAFGTDVFNITPSDVPSGNIVGNLFTQTRVEAGKYVDARTFVMLSQQAGRPGFSVEHRTSDGWEFTTSLSSRILLREPTLTSQPFRIVQVYGVYIIREWRF